MPKALYECKMKHLQTLMVGRVAAANMIITTEAFTHFDAPRKFNWYGGVAPSSYSSGSSQYSKVRISADN